MVKHLHLIVGSLTLGKVNRYSKSTDSFKVNAEAEEMLTSELCRGAGEHRQVTLACGTLADLGYTERPALAEFLGDSGRLTRYGLAKLPADAALCLRRTYINQPQGEWFYICMDSMRVSGKGRPHVFAVGSDGYDLVLFGISPRAHSDQLSLEVEWVFELTAS